MKVNGIEITNETVIATRAYYIDNCEKCIVGAINGDFRVNDLDKYIKWQRQCIVRTTNGENDHTLTFLQHALWLQTGETVAILA